MFVSIETKGKDAISTLNSQVYFILSYFFFCSLQAISYYCRNKCKNRKGNKMKMMFFAEQLTPFSFFYLNSPTKIVYDCMMVNHSQREEQKGGGKDLILFVFNSDVFIFLYITY